MVDETNHLFDAAQALDGKLSDKTINPENVAKDGLDMIPEDATEVPDIRDITAIRSQRDKSRRQGE
ncbi:hypothetical protein [Brucella grignonensis]|uniref:Uncharacterized protein n=1 Tax=Brucella grignonensis TaxID=94627 RepID=A0A256GD95_9HYPH|nr:hypothetical protein [Brucella grignonensis]NKB84850.1 hypothetical protein [Brucella grignonensis]NKB84868.1 hypothetical protein [Brucella grignonensis]NKB84885.1 hypothetical protein [Brucella grignonensis]OYR24886.1 hypothetical protein CEV33_4625 [Brucella grignonensis]